jgi:hypothetical protein
MIFGMIRSCTVALLLSAATLAQDSPAPKVRMLLTEGIHPEMVYVRYGLRKSSGYYSSQVAGMPAGVSYFEIPAPTDRFKALVWAPGCKIQEFDASIGKSDIELRYACDPLKTITLRGRVKSVHSIGPMTLSVDYMGSIACTWADATELMRMYSCSGLDISGVATAEVAPDGSFEIELPDFNDDPIAAHASHELALWLKGIKEIPPFLVPESTSRNSFKFAASYPDEVIFVPLDSEDYPKAN